MKKLKILCWNANGLTNKINELAAILTLQNIDICLISETHDTKETRIKVSGYCYYRSIHPSNTGRGGSAVLIKQEIKHAEDFTIQTTKTQIAAIRVSTKCRVISIASIYNPPRYRLEADEYKNIFDQLSPSFIIGGDFNLKHTFFGSRITNEKGKILYQVMTEEKCHVASTGKPTYWPTDLNKKPDLIDFFVLRNINASYIDIEECLDLSSDHSSIILTLSESVIWKERNLALTNRKTDWDKFKLEIAEDTHLTPIELNEEIIDQEVCQLMDSIQKHALNNTPLSAGKTKTACYPQHILDLIKMKRKSRNKWQQTRDPYHKASWNRIANKLRLEIQRFKIKEVNEYVGNLSYTKSADYSLWKAVKHIKRPITPIPPIKSDLIWIKNNQGKADLFADYLEKIFTPNPPERGESPLPEIPTREIDIEIQPVTTNEIIKTIKNEINCKKAPGFDYITGEILKNLPRKVIVKIKHIVNACFNLRYVPKLWKVAQVIMIPKPGKPVDQCTSYRPISLLPVLSKLFEKLFLKRLHPVIEKRKIIPNHQFGFRKQHSTIDQVHRIVNLIEETLEDGKVCSAVFLDVAQAFDKVWHEGLHYKLKKLLPAKYAELLHSYLSQRHFRVKQDDAYSELKSIKAGVPQGSVLGPILYILYTSDLPEVTGTTTATFADDTAILAVGADNNESIEKITSSLSKLEGWTKRWRIKINENKSIHVDFTNKRLQYIPMKFNGTTIPHANEAKYLGMTLDARLRWKSHVKKKKQEFYLKYRSMYWLLGRCSMLPLECKILLYQQVLKPIWSYGCQLWGCTAESNRQIIQRLQNTVLRNIVAAPWYYRNDDLHRELAIQTVSEVIQNSASNHFLRLQGHPNKVAADVLTSTKSSRRLRRTKPSDLVL